MKEVLSQTVDCKHTFSKSHYIYIFNMCLNKIILLWVTKIKKKNPK